MIPLQKPSIAGTDTFDYDKAARLWNEGRDTLTIANDSRNRWSEAHVWKRLDLIKAHARRIRGTHGEAS